MAKEKDDCCQDKKWKCNACPGGNGGGAVYGLGFIGALVYYIGTAGSFGAGVLGVLKAIVWPAMMVYHLFNFLKM